MSEYQYYEFQAIDRPLTTEERAEVSKLSSRVRPTASQAVFTYSFGDFHGDPLQVLARYYDAMLYVANWGTRQLAFRFPRSVVNGMAFEPYMVEDIISTRLTHEYLILDIIFHDEDAAGGWIEAEGTLSSLLGLRDELLHEDLRVLYLAWLKAALLADWQEDEDPQEPPVPPNLHKLSAPLQSFVEFVELDPDLLAVAAEASRRSPGTTSPEPEIWVPKLSENEKNDYLIRLARGEPHLDLQLARRLQALALPGSASSPSLGQRRLSYLLAAAEEHTRRRQERERQEAEQARIRKLRDMIPRESRIWEQVIAQIEKKQASSYDEATQLLVDLRDLADLLGQLSQFQARLGRIRQDYRNRPAFIARLNQAGLV